MKILQAIILFVIVSHMTACNTWAGFGKDLQRGGEAIERSVK